MDNSIHSDRLVTAQTQLGDSFGAHENAIRPAQLKEYIGQKQVRDQMDLFMLAAKSRAESLDHVLLYGPPGLGKTTLSYIIAHEMGAQLKSTSGPVLEKAGDLAAILTRIEPGDVLFVDEIHRLSPQVEEVLYPAMEDFQLDIMIGDGPAAQSVKIDLPPFTLVGATTRAGLLTAPLRDRFGIVQRLEYYTPDELTQIVARSAQILGIAAEHSGAQEIAKRARGTPRIANRLLRRVRDFAQIRGQGVITREIADAALSLLEVDPHGLDKMDMRFLEALVHKFAGGPAGIETLATSIGEDKGTLEEVIEPYLVQQGFVVRTPRGRLATDATYRHLGVPRPEKA